MSAVARVAFDLEDLVVVAWHRRMLRRERRDRRAQTSAAMSTNAQAAVERERPDGQKSPMRRGAISPSASSQTTAELDSDLALDRELGDDRVAEPGADEALQGEVVVGREDDRRLVAGGAPGVVDVAHARGAVAVRDQLLALELGRRDVVAPVEAAAGRRQDDVAVAQELGVREPASRTSIAPRRRR